MELITKLICAQIVLKTMVYTGKEDKLLGVYWMCSHSPAPV